MYVLEQVVTGWLLKFVGKRAIWLVFILLAAWAFLLRYVHALNPDRYYLLGPDSHFFHWLAERVIAGQGPPPGIPEEAIYTLHTGLAYPIAYIAKTVSSTFNMPPGDALELVAKLLPPVLGIISLIVIFLVASRIYDIKTGFLTALSWVLMLHTVFLGASGLIDRDGLITFLIMLGVLLFYFSKDWHLKIGGRDVGWIVTSLGVCSIEGLLYLGWSVVGSALLLALIIFYFFVTFFLKFMSMAELKVEVKERVLLALNEVGGRAFGVLILLNILVLVAFYNQAGSWFGFLRDMFVYSGDFPVQELRGIGLRDFTVYHLFLIPMAGGLYITLKKRNKASVLFACWFLFYLILSVFSRRILIFAVPAACFLSGLGLMSMWNWTKTTPVAALKKVVVLGFILLTFVVSFITATSIGSEPVMSVDKEWEEALTYLREETPQDSLVMTQWSWGYWILDLGERKPLVDNGFYGYPSQKLKDVGSVYTTTKPSEAVQIMEKYDADYVIFSKLDLDKAQKIMQWADPDSKGESFPEDSLAVRSLEGEFESGDGLKVIYRSAPQSEVVILGLETSG